MEALDKERIAQGRKILMLALIVLGVTSLIYAFFYMGAAEDQPFFKRFTTLNWFVPPMVLLMGAGVVQGSKPVRWILSLLLFITVGFEGYLFLTFGMPSTSSAVLFVLTGLLSLAVVYLIMIDGKVEDFLLYQRSRNYGEYVKVEGSVVGPPTSEGQAEEDSSETPVEEVAAPVSGKRKSGPSGKKPRKESNAWEDELGIYEED